MTNNTKGQHAFISDMPADEELTQSIKDRLRLEGYTSWTDRKAINYSDESQFQEDIYQVIAKSDVFVYILTSKTGKSGWAQSELRIALSLNKKILLIELEDFITQEPKSQRVLRDLASEDLRQFIRSAISSFLYGGYSINQNKTIRKLIKAERAYLFSIVCAFLMLFATLFLVAKLLVTLLTTIYLFIPATVILSVAAYFGVMALYQRRYTRDLQRAMDEEFERNPEFYSNLEHEIDILLRD